MEPRTTGRTAGSTVNTTSSIANSPPSQRYQRQKETPRSLIRSRCPTLHRTTSHHQQHFIQVQYNMHVANKQDVKPRSGRRHRKLFAPPPPPLPALSERRGLKLSSAPPTPPPLPLSGRRDLNLLLLPLLLILLDLGGEV